MKRIAVMLLAVCMMLLFFSAEVWAEENHSHRYSDTVVEPSCTEDGYTLHSCSCGESYIDSVVPAVGHQYAKAYCLPTCTQQGFTYYFCHCGVNFTADYVPATGHDWVEEIVPPACNQYGYVLRTCNTCGETERTNNAFPLMHRFTESLIPGTCQEFSYRLFTCELCGHSYTENTFQRGEHVMGEGVVTIEPTITTEGEMRWYCELCSALRWEVLPALGCPFVDVNEDQYYYDPVIWAVTRSVTSGTDATHFSPDRNCTRGQVVTFLWRAAGCPKPMGAENPFSDVKQEHYFCDAVLWAVEQGITQGVGSGRFAPDQEVTRAQFVTFLWRWAGKAELPDAVEPFDDVSEGDYYSDAVIWAMEHGITKGVSANRFGANSGCTRGQVVTFLYRYDRNPHASGNWFSPPNGVEIYRHDLWEGKKAADLSGLPSFDERPTPEHLKLVLEACAPDSAFFLRWDQEEFVSWLYEDGTVTSDTNTATHETYHAFSGFGSKDQCYYLGDGYCVDVETTYSYHTSEIDAWIPAEHHTFRYDLYVLGSEHANMWSIIGGAYGLMNEFNAYGTGMMYNVSMFDYYCAQGMEYDAMMDYVNGAENDRMAYAEFRYWILTYLLYARENHPSVYDELMENTALRYAFTVVEGRYAENIAQYEKQLEQLTSGSIPGFDRVRVEEDMVWFGSYGIGRFTEDYEMLMEYMERPEYQEALEAFRVH